MRAGHGRRGACPPTGVAEARGLRRLRRGGGGCLPGGSLTADLDSRVRLALYERFVEDGEPPAAGEVAASLGIPPADAEAAYHRLADAHVIVLVPRTSHVWMAAPLSAVPTAFRVETPRGAYYGNCIWDGLGVVAMLDGEGTVETRCPDCEQPMTLRVVGGELIAGEGVAHFAVPAARWWDDIGFT